ncbi:MAG: transglutaminase domain-containing protein [Dehalococcoidia bacterium]|nr:transglutaminase domain-containing protein [Dehalococcoidia bacterium]MDW8120101.1 transglutaminase domain-containing protein [Chloroflexota bacterium]
MSTAHGEIALARPGRYRGVERIYQMVRPRAGWSTALLVVFTLLALVWSVDRAGWAATPNLTLVVLGAVVCAWLLDKVRVNGWLLQPVGLVLGAGLTYLLAGTLTEGRNIPAQIAEVNLRLAAFWKAFRTGGISTDTLPFAVALTAVGWLVAWVSAWSAFRLRNMWLAVLPSALALLTNLSYLPAEFFIYFYIYLFFAMLLAARLHTLRQREVWERVGVQVSPAQEWLALNDALWLTVLVLLVTATLPLQAPTAPPLRRAWEEVRAPIDRLENEFNRMFSGLPARKAVPFRSFGLVLPFQGPITLSNEPIFYVSALRPAYWVARIYTLYTPQGWLTETTEVRDLGWVSPDAVPQQYQARQEMVQEVTLAFPTSELFATEVPLQASLPLQMEVLAPKSFTLLLSEGIRQPELPPDLQEARERLMRLRFARLQEDPVDALLNALPEDVLVTRLIVGGGPGGGRREVDIPPGEGYRAALEQALLRLDVLRGVVVTRRHPAPPDIVALQARDRLAAGFRYQITSAVSIATEEDLRQAGTDYPSWVTDRYLQLPESLPSRVRELAQTLTRNAPTPYDKALAIQEYLHTYTYTLNVEAPPFDADGVDYFLFVSKKGYSEYFASAMTVLLRAVGVPARVAAGYAPGVLDQEKKVFVVRDLDSHAWTQVYFPGYGWIDFEPTPGRPAPPRGPLPEMSTEGGDIAVGALEDAFFPEDDVFLGEEGGGGMAPRGALRPWSLSLLTSGGVLAVLALALWLLYQRTVAAAGRAEDIFRRMVWLGGLAGVPLEPHQTPHEFAQRLGQVAPEAEGDIGYIADAFARTRYGRQSLGMEEQERLRQAWRLARRALWRKVLRR